MNDNLSQYLKDLETNTAVTMQNEQISNREMAFTHYVLSQIATKVGAEDYQVQHIEIKNIAGNYLGEIFGYNESANQEVLTLFYTIYDGSSSGDIKVLTDTDLQPAWNRLQGFYEKVARNAYLDMDETAPGYEAIKMMSEHSATYQTIRFYILSNCSIQRSQPKKMRIRNKETDCNVWDLKKLAGNLTDNSDHVEIDIDFENDEDYNHFKIPYIQMTPDENGYKCLLMMFPAKLLYKLYKKWNTDLLMYNVRFWLTFKKTKRKHTNSDIRDTLRNEKSMFLAYNNGLTAIATSVKTEENMQSMNVGEEDSNGYITSNDLISTGILKGIKNFQIVNGGQTTASIFKSKDQDPNISLIGTFVQVKLIVLSENQNVKKLASKISKSSNSQNAVKDSDFTVSEEFNTRMQELSTTIKIPNTRGDITYWFYERIRGQYEEERNRNHRKEDMDLFLSKFPRKNIFSKELLAIVRKSWEGEPADAVKGSGTTYDLFITKIIEKCQLPDDVYYTETIAMLIIYLFLKARPENKDYKNAKASVICYTLAMVHRLTFDTLDLDEIWRNQELKDSQVKALNRLSEIVYRILTELAENAGTTVLSYGKRKNTFDELYIRATDLYNEDILGLIKQLLA